MGEIFRDLRYGWSLLLRFPAASAVAVMSLALGIGANTAVFSFASAFLYRPLPVADPDRLVRIFTTYRGDADLNHSSYPDFRDIRDRADAFEGVAAYFYFPMGLSVNGSPEVVLGQLVSANYFSVMGVQPALGRSFLPEEDRPPDGRNVAIVSHRLWERRFGSAPDVVGADVLVNSHPFTVIGVAPKGFTAPNVIMAPDVWVPLTTVGRTLPYPISLDDAHDTWLLLAGRLKGDLSLPVAQSATDALAAALARERPDSNEDRGYRLVEADRARIALKDTTDTQERAALLLLTVVGLVLLVACLNVANLKLAVAVERRKEIALRYSLGASGGRLLRQLLTESLLLAGVAGALGLVVAVWTIEALLALQPEIIEIPLEIDARLDWRTLGFASVIALGSGLAFGLAPAWQALRVDQFAALKDSPSIAVRGRGVARAQAALVAAQVALSFVLLVSAGLFLRSLTNTLEIDPGFDTERGVLVPIDLGFGDYDESKGRPFFRRIVETVEGIPGVQSASLALDVPLGQLHIRNEVEIDGYPQEPGDRLFLRGNVVGARYFETLGIRLVAGRGIDERDRQASQPAAVVNETMARRFWPGEDPIGRTFRSHQATWTIVGVARDATYDELDEAPQSFFWMSLAQTSWFPRVVLHVRTAGSASALVQPVVRAVQDLDRDLPLGRAMTMETFLQNAVEETAGPGRLLSAFGLIALVLAVVGTYGLMSYVAGRRRREFGVRVALGADRSRLSRLVLLQGVRIGVSGAVVGLAITLAVTRLLASSLYGVHPYDPVVLGAVALAMVGVTGAACYLPARAAARADPAAALRAE